MTTDRKPKSDWQKALEQYRKLEKEGRLDEIEDVPGDVHERVRKATHRLLADRDL